MGEFWGNGWPEALKLREFLKTALYGSSNGVYGNEYTGFVGKTDDGIEVRRAKRSPFMKYGMGVEIWGEEYLGNGRPDNMFEN